MGYKARYTIPIYNFVFNVLVADDITKVVNDLAYELGGKPLDGIVDGCALFIDGNIYLCLQTDCISHNLIAHEITHVVTDSLNGIGMKWSPDSTEAYSYLAGWLTEKVYVSLAKWNCAVKLKDLPTHKSPRQAKEI